jgi:hypothetical protein
MWIKIRLLTLVAAALKCVSPAGAEEMRAIEARDFIVGDHFSYTCFDGTTGNGRIYADGSVAGYVQQGGTGPRRYRVYRSLRTIGCAVSGPLRAWTDHQSLSTHTRRCP